MELSSGNKDCGCIWTTVLVYLCIVTWVIGNFMLSPSLLLKSSSKKEKFSYNLYELQSIRGKISTYRKHGLLPPSTVARIRSLQIQRKRKRGQRGGVSKDTKLHSNGLDQKVNKGNLIQIVPSFHIIQKQNMTKMIKIALVNVQSIKRKEIILLDELMARNIDICAVTETWLKDTMYDKTWVDTSGFKMNFWDSKWVNRVGKRGGGIGIIWNISKMKCKEISHGAWPTFEFGIWKFSVRNHNKTLAIVTIYRPPGKEPISKFCDEFSEFLSSFDMDYDSVVYMGDFNIHVNNPYDTNMEQFLDMLSALGLDQCVKEATHKQNNTLDLILMEAVSNIRIFNIHTGTYISDHKLIEAILEFTPDRIVQNECKVRNLKNRDMDKFMDTLHLPAICKLETVELIWTEFCTNIQSGLDTCAPLKSIKMGTKNNKSWYNNDLRQQ